MRRCRPAPATCTTVTSSAPMGSQSWCGRKSAVTASVAFTVDVAAAGAILFPLPPCLVVRQGKVAIPGHVAYRPCHTILCCLSSRRRETVVIPYRADRESATDSPRPPLVSLSCMFMSIAARPGALLETPNAQTTFRAFLAAMHYRFPAQCSARWLKPLLSVATMTTL